jgi:hypothetical protein
LSDVEGKIILDNTANKKKRNKVKARKLLNK